MELRSGNIYYYQDRQSIDNRKYQNELNYKFFNWKQRINRMFYSICQVHIDDLPDEPYYDMFCENVRDIQVFYKLYIEHILPFQDSNF